MASTTEIMLVDPAPGAALRGELRLRQLEQRWSRFLSDSDITRLNHSDGAWTAVSDDTIGLIEAMQLGSLATSGSYDPTQLHRLLQLGYTTSIDDDTLVSSALGEHDPGHSVHDVAIDRQQHRVRVPHEMALDPGGIGKGLAADWVVVELLGAGTAGALVSVGGDIAAAGTAPTTEGWHVSIEDPLHPPHVVTTMAVSAGGIATSSTRSRRWTDAGTERHHVLDPSTGTMSSTDVASMTVIARSAWLAEVHATAAMLCGAEGAADYLARYGLTGVVIGLDGAVFASADLDMTTHLNTGVAV